MLQVDQHCKFVARHKITNSQCNHHLMSNLVFVACGVVVLGGVEWAVLVTGVPRGCRVRTRTFSGGQFRGKVACTLSVTYVTSSTR